MMSLALLCFALVNFNLFFLLFSIYYMYLILMRSKVFTTAYELFTYLFTISILYVLDSPICAHFRKNGNFLISYYNFRCEIYYLTFQTTALFTD